MAKDLELDALLGDVPDLGERQLARQRHAVRPALARPAHAAGVVDVRLGRDVQLELGPRAPDGLEQAPVLDDERIGATKRRRAHERERPSISSSRTTTLMVTYTRVPARCAARHARSKAS